jgi:hypothetical protein
MSRRGTSNRQEPSRIAWPLAATLAVAGVTAVVGIWGATIRDPVTGCLLGVLAMLSYLADRRFALPIWFVALFACGPLCALLIVVVPELVRPVLERDRPPRPIASLATFASFAWAVAAGAAALALVPGAHAARIVERWPAYAVACTAMVVLNVVITAGIVQCLVDRRRLPWSHLGAMLVFVPLAAVVACVYGVAGTPALALFAACAWLPGVLVHTIAPVLAPRAAAIDPRRAQERYALAIAASLELSRGQRRRLRSACRARGWIDPVGASSELFGVGYALFHQRIAERSGGGDWMPIDACVLEIAAAWAQLTAAGTLELSHSAALSCLEAEKWRYSARVLRAAWTVIDEQPRESRRRSLLPVGHPLSLRITALASRA